MFGPRWCRTSQPHLCTDLPTCCARQELSISLLRGQLLLLHTVCIIEMYVLCCSGLPPLTPVLLPLTQAGLALLHGVWGGEGGGGGQLALHPWLLSPAALAEQ
jgi:hypothetical protein